MPNQTSQVINMPMRDPRKAKIVSRQSAVPPGYRGAGDGGGVHGGGGPENMGARSSQAANLPFYETRPSWSGDDLALSEYTGYAAPSITPNVAGIPANSFRFLGDNHGGRQ